jgi:hypothetical protein
LVLRDAEGKNKFTMKDLTNAISANAAYQASVLDGADINAEELDFYNGLQIKGVPAVLKRDMHDTIDYLNTYSALVTAEKIENVYGPLAIFSVAKFFTGATDGVSANSDYAAGFEAFKEERIHCVVPLISKDKGSVTIDSINQLAAAHAGWSWQTDGKSERHAFVAKDCSKADLKKAIKALNSAHVTMVGHSVQVLDRSSNLVWMDAWALACLAAGMRAGAEVGEPLTFKFVNVNDIRVADGSWSAKKDGVEMLDAGLLVVEASDGGGFRFVCGNTTYGIDESFVWNRESVVQAAGYVAYDLRTNLERVFTGRKARTGTAEAIANFIKARMSAYLGADIIVGDDLNGGLGYYEKKLRVSVEGNTAAINVSITPVQGIDFILPTIYLADIRQSA